MNIGDLLNNTASKEPNKTAIVYGSLRLSYKEFNRRVNRLAHALLGMGLRKGDKVALLSFNSSWFVEIYVATLKAGGMFTPINSRLTPGEITYILDNSDAGVFLFEKEFDQVVNVIRPAIHNIEHYICIGGNTRPNILDYEQLMSNQPDSELNVAVSEKNGCELLYTSGTTGRPKGVVLTHENVSWNLMNTINGRELRPGQICLIAGPLSHSAALNNHFTTTMALGGTCVIMRQFDPKTFMELVQNEKVEVISGSPTLFNLLLQFPEVGKYDTSSVTQVQSGAAPLRAATKDKLTQLFPNAVGVYDVYGCTEASPSIAILSGKDSLRKQACVGKPVSFLQAKLVDDESQKVRVGQVGEIICKGPNVMKEYYKNKEATEEAIRDEWLYTGDLGRLDDEGYLYIVGRKKDMIVSGGENIYPQEIERVLYTHPKIADAAVIGIPDEIWGESVRAVITVKAGEKMTEDEVIEFCKEHLASYKKPKSIIFVDALPKNPLGKVSKKELRAMYG